MRLSDDKKNCNLNFKNIYRNYSQSSAKITKKLGNFMNPSPLLELTASFKGILLDAYGVFWSGNARGLIPGADTAMEALVKQGKLVGILSNATKLGAFEIEKVKKHGLYLDKHFHFFITSGDLARKTLLEGKLPFSTPSKRYFVLGGPYDHSPIHKDIFAGTQYEETDEIEKASFIYVSTPQIQGKDQVDPSLFTNHVEQCYRANLPMLCANPDLFAHEGNPARAVVRQGSLAKMYEKMGGQVHYIGKPQQEAFQEALSAFRRLNDLSPSDILMIGDTPETDIRGSKASGMSSALIYETGVMAERVYTSSLDASLISLSKDDYPHYLLQRLGL